MCKKDVTETATIVDIFNDQFPKAQTRGSRFTRPPRIIDNTGMEDTELVIQVNSPPIPSTPSSITTLPDHQVLPPAPLDLAITHIPNQVFPPPSSNGFSDLYSSESVYNSISNEMVGSNNNPIKSISRYIRYYLVLSLNHIPPKVDKKRLKTLHWRQFASIRRT